MSALARCRSALLAPSTLPHARRLATQASTTAQRATASIRRVTPPAATSAAVANRLPTAWHLYFYRGFTSSAPRLGDNDKDSTANEPTPNEEQSTAHPPTDATTESPPEVIELPAAKPVNLLPDHATDAVTDASAASATPPPTGKAIVPTEAQPVTTEKDAALATAHIDAPHIPEGAHSPSPHLSETDPAVTEAAAAAATAAAAAAAAKKAAHDAEIANAKFAPIPTRVMSEEDTPDPKPAPNGDAASIPKMESSHDVIRGTLWFDNVFPLRVHWLDLRYLVATNNHHEIIPRLFAKAFGVHGFQLISATPRANEGGVYVHFEVNRQGTIRTPDDVQHTIIKLLRAEPIHAWLTPKAVRCHLVRGSPFLDDITSRFPYNRLKMEFKGPATALSDLTIEQVYAEFVQFGKIADLTLNPYEKDKPRQGSVQFVRMYSAVGARNCLHRLRLSVPLVVTSLPASTPPKEEATGIDAASLSSSNSLLQPTPATKPKPPAVPTAEAMVFLNYDSILKTSYVTDFFVKHPRIMVPLLGLLFAAFTFLIFDPLRSFNIRNHITHRLALHNMYARLPWPFSWLRQQASAVTNSDFVRKTLRGIGLEEDHPDTHDLWSARQADEEKVRKWLNSKPDRLLFLTGAKGAGKAQLVNKLTSDRQNVVTIDIGHIIDRTDDEFVKGLASAVGFAPGFAVISFLSNVMDVFTPGASKATGSSTATPAQILKILECTSNALVSIAKQEERRIQAVQAKRLARLTPEQRAALEAHPQPVDERKAKAATDNLSAAATVMDKPPVQPAPKEDTASTLAKLTTSFTNAVGLGPKTPPPPSQTIAPANVPANANGGASGANAAPANGNGNTAAANHNAAPPANPNADTTPSALPGGTSVPLRLNEKVPHPLEGEHLTEQQRNYHAYMQSRSEQEAKDKADAKAAGLHHAARNKFSGLVEHEPDNLPLFVIDGFNSENASKHGNFLQVLVSWSAEMSAAGAARFVFLTDAALEEQVAKSLPEVKIAEVLLSDASPEAAQEYLFSTLPPAMRRAIPDEQTVAALEILGGRYNDLVTLRRGVENGIHPIETVEEIVTQSMNSVKNLLFTEDKAVKWTKVQMWQVLSLLANSQSGTVLYDDCLFNVFQGDDTPLKAMVRSDLLRVEPALSSGGDRLRAGSPVMQEAFRRLLHQQAKLRPGMDLLVVKWQIGVEQAKIDKIEEELMRIAKAADEVIAQQTSVYANDRASYAYRRREKGWDADSSSDASSTSPAYLFERQKFLIRLLNDSHVKIAALDEKRRACEKEVKAIKKIE